MSQTRPPHAGMDGATPSAPESPPRCGNLGVVMDLAWLDDFLAVIDSGSLPRAAEARDVTPAVLTRRLRALEDWVGAPLFDRDGSPAVLTDAGRRFRPVAEETLRRLLQGREETRAAAQADAATLRFATTPSLALTVFPPWLRALEQKGRLGPVTLSSDGMEAGEQAMLAGRAHFLLCHAHPNAARPRQTSDAVQSILVGQDRLLPVCAPDGDGRPRHPLPGRAEAPVPSLSYSRESGLGRILEATRSAAPAAAWLHTVFTAPTTPVLRSLARDGRGLAWLPESLIADDLNRGSLVPAGDSTWTLPLQIRLIRSRARQSKAVESFWTLAVEAALWRGGDPMINASEIFTAKDM
jgi:LysR family transcriptional regulator, hypochlorite-specific transcription factor HypT